MASQLTMLKKMELTAPYNIFFNKFEEIPETLTQDNAINFSDLVCPSLGKLKCSLQLTGKVDNEWLMDQFAKNGVKNKPVTVLCGEEKGSLKIKVEECERKFPNVTQCRVVPKIMNETGNHHCKMAIFVYEDNSLRIAILSSNLHQDHWDRFNHTIWLSPLCPPLQCSSASSGDSPTNFKRELLIYLNEYENKAILKPWISYVKGANFQNIKVFLVTSYPGFHPHSKFGTHLQQTAKILKDHCPMPSSTRTWPVVIQASCLGQYGRNENDWMRSQLLKSLANEHCREVPFEVVYPTYENVKNNYFGVEGGEGIRYLEEAHAKQKWLERYLYQWKADALGRSTVLPHSKLYCRVSPSCDKMAWFMLTNANASKGAWGNTRPRMNTLLMRNYELGVLFIPKFFGLEYFPLAKGGGGKVFPMLFDFPLTKYGSRDKPWTLVDFGEISLKWNRQLNIR